MVKEIKEFSEKVTEERLKEDLEKYRKLAMELGATDAKVVTKDVVIIDERVRARCSSPRCPYYGSNLNCPPHTTWNLDQTRTVVSKYGICLAHKKNRTSHLPLLI